MLYVHRLDVKIHVIYRYFYELGNVHKCTVKCLCTHKAKVYKNS